MDSKGKSQQQADIERLQERAIELQQTQDRLMRELGKSIEATSEVLKGIESRGKG